MSKPSTPSGWYDDPDQPTMQRYWDGEDWTDDRRSRPEERVQAPSPTAGSDLFADDPIDGITHDLLGHAAFADQIVRVLEALREQTPSGVCALAGPWGSGKSSVLNMLEAKLQGSSGWRVISFNPWLLSDEASLIRQFFGALASVLPDKRRWKSSRKKLARYLTAISPVAGVLQVPGLDLGKATEAASRALEGETSLDARKKELERALDELPSPVLVLLDDLDRLHTTELLLVFKLVRLIGRLPNVYYVLAFDEATVIDRLQATELGMSSQDRAFTFLEKIYQVRVELPPLHTSRRLLLLDAAVEEFLSRNGESLSPEDEYRLTTAYHKLMDAHLRTPRQIKRYVAQLDVYYPLVKAEVDLVDFMLITFLRASLPRLYALLSDSKNELTRTMESALRRDNRDRNQQRDDFMGWIGGAGVDESQAQSVLEFLAGLFLPIKAVTGWIEPATWEYTQLARHKRVGSADYFDRYFYFGVQPDDVSDQVIESALEELELAPAVPVVGLLEISKRRGSVVFEKLLIRRDMLSRRQRAGVIHLLADMRDDLSDQMFAPSRLRAALLGAELLPDADGNALDVDRLTADSSHVLFTAHVLSRVARRPTDSGQPPSPDWLAGLTEQFVLRAFGLLEEAMAEPLEDHADWATDLLFRLRELTTPTDVTNWLLDRLDQSAWTVEDLAAALVPIATAYGEGQPTKVLGHADVLDALVLLLPLEWILARVEGLDEAGEPMDRLTMTEYDLSFENRVRHAKAVIRNRLEQGNLPFPDPSDASADVAASTAMAATEEE